jgi:hypothetical protein
MHFFFCSIQNWVYIQNMHFFIHSSFLCFFCCYNPIYDVRCFWKWQRYVKYFERVLREFDGHTPTGRR